MFFDGITEPSVSHPIDQGSMDYNGGAFLILVLLLIKVLRRIMKPLAEIIFDCEVECNIPLHGFACSKLLDKLDTKLV